MSETSINSFSQIVFSDFSEQYLCSVKVSVDNFNPAIIQAHGQVILDILTSLVPTLEIQDDIFSVASNNAGICFLRFMEYPSSDELTICACIALQFFLFRFCSWRRSLFLHWLHGESNIPLWRFYSRFRFSVAYGL